MLLLAMSAKKIKGMTSMLQTHINVGQHIPLMAMAYSSSTGVNKFDFVPHLILECTYRYVELNISNEVIFYKY